MLDAIIISDSGSDSMSGTNPLKLTIDGRIADIQVVHNFVRNQGQIVQPIEGDGVMSWASAPRLNGIYLFNHLMNNGFEVELIDCFYAEKDRFCRLLEHSPRAVILSTTFICGKQPLTKLVSDIRNLAPDIVIIAGGALVYLSYLMRLTRHRANYPLQEAAADYLFLEIADEPAIDLYIVSLRGEKILNEAMHRLKSNQSFSDLPNSAQLQNNGYHFSGRIDDISDFEDFPIDWQSLPANIFKSGVIPLQASIGCPYSCAFCNFTKDHRMTFIKPIQQLISEMKAVQARGSRYVWFVDDNFRLGKRDVERVCQRFIEEHITLRWMTFVRASTLKDMDITLLKQAGCVEVQLGLESVDAQVLKNMNKNADFELYNLVLHKLLSAGINCSCYFLFGFPGETEQSAERTREFIKLHPYPNSEGMFSWSIFPFLLAPLSPIYEPEVRKKYGLTGYMKKWLHDTMNSDQAKEEVVRTFFEVENSGPIYRGDNLGMLENLEPAKRKKFQEIRHRFSKAALKGMLEKKDMIDSFAEILKN